MIMPGNFKNLGLRKWLKRSFAPEKPAKFPKIVGNENEK